MNLQYHFNYWLLQTVAMILTALLVPRLRITGITGALMTVVGIALVNAYLWDTALFFELPESLSLRAALLFVTNGMIFWLLVKLLPGIEVDGLLPALVAPVVFTCCSVFIATYAHQVNWQEVFAVTERTVETVFSALKSYFERHS